MPKGNSAPPPRRRRYKGLLFLVGVAALVWFAPAIVAHTPLKQKFIDRALANAQGRAEVGSAQLGWFSPVVLRNVKLLDAEGELVVEVVRVESERSLLTLARDQAHIGKWRVEEPTIYLELRPGGSNLEDIFVPMLATPSSSGPDDTLAVELAGGTLHLSETTSLTEETFDDLAGGFRMPAKPGEPIAIELSGAIAAGGQPGQFELTAALPLEQPAGDTPPVTETSTAPAENLATGSPHATLKAGNLSLDWLGMVLGRFEIGCRTLGRADADLVIEWNGDDGTVCSFDGLLSGHDVALADASWLNGDRPQLTQLNCIGAIALNAEGWQAEELNLDCDLGQVQANGAIRPLEMAAHLSPYTKWLHVAAEDFSITGNLDLAALARMLPNTLRLKPGLVVERGALGFDISTRDDDAIRGELHIENIEAQDASRVVSWPDPVTLRMMLPLEDQTAQAELVCESEFLAATGKANLESGELWLAANLDVLAQRIGQFVELPAESIAGRVELDLTWQREEDSQFRTSGELTAQSFVLAAADLPPWREDQLTATFRGLGTIEENQLTQLEECHFELRSGGDELIADITQPVAWGQEETTWPLAWEIKGNLTTWQRRLQPFASLAGWQLAGTAQAEGELTLSPQRIEIRNLESQVEHLLATSGEWHIDEPLAQISLDGSWDRTARRFTASELVIASTSVSARGEAIEVQLAESGPPTLAGSLDYRADLGRVCRWIHDPQAATWHATGQGEGELSFRTSEEGTEFSTRATVTDLAYFQASELGAVVQPVSSAWEHPTGVRMPLAWSEPQLTLAAVGEYTSQRLELTSSQIGSEACSVTAAGTVDALSTAPNVNLNGEVTYNLALLVERFRGMVGEGLALEGQSTRQFTLRGPLRPAPTATLSAAQPNSPTHTPLVSRELTGSGSLSWQRANLYGLEVGAGTLDGQLREGTIDFQPLDFPVGGGRFRFSPRVLLNGDPPALTAQPGPLLDRVQLDEAMCREWLKFVAPMLADATQAQGLFSVQLNALNLPLAAPKTGTSEGIVSIHTAQVGPGPLAQQLITISRQVKAAAEGNPLNLAAPSQTPWLMIQEQQVAYRMENGRVYHEGMTIYVGDVPVTTSGWVGLDESLDIVAEFPILDEWVQNEGALASLSGQVLQVPITGTLRQPNLDERALENLAGQTLGEAAGRLLEGELNRQLDRLFGPRP